MLGANHVSQVRRRALPAASTSPSTSRGEKSSAYYNVIAIIGGFFPQLFQIGFQLLDGLVEGRPSLLEPSNWIKLCDQKVA